MPTTLDEKKKIIRHYLENMVFPRNLDVMGNYMADNVVDHSAPPGLPSGVEGAKMFLSMCYAAFPRTEYEIQHVIGDGDHVTVVFTIEGDHTGTPFFGTPPSGKTFKVQCIEVLRVPESKYVEHWGGMDFIDLSRQLGLGLFGENKPQETPADKARKLAQQYIDGINTKNLDMVADVFADSFIDHQVAPTGITGNTKADVMKAHELLDDAFPDVQFNITNMVFEGDTLFMHIAAEGTNTGSYFGMPATGKRIRWTGVRVLKYEDGSVGRFVEGTSELDRFSILQQMGIIPATPVQYDTEGNKAVVTRLIDGLNAGNFDAYDEALAPDAITHQETNPKPIKGTKQLKQTDMFMRYAFPDLNMQIDDIRAEEDKVAVRVLYSATHSGNFMGVPGTGKKCMWTGTLIHRLEDGKIVERWTNTDMVTLLQQVGLIPAF